MPGDRLLTDEEVFGAAPKPKARVNLSPLEQAFEKMAESIQGDNTKVVTDAVEASLAKARVGSREETMKAVREIVAEAMGRIKMPDMSVLGGAVAEAIAAVGDENRKLVAQIVASNKEVAGALKALAAAEQRELKVEMKAEKSHPMATKFIIDRNEGGDMTEVTVVHGATADPPKNAMEAASRAAKGS